jgi:hypothetical protein
MPPLSFNCVCDGRREERPKSVAEGFSTTSSILKISTDRSRSSPTFFFSFPFLIIFPYYFVFPLSVSKANPSFLIFLLLSSIWSDVFVWMRPVKMSPIVVAGGGMRTTQRPTTGFGLDRKKDMIETEKK